MTPAQVRRIAELARLSLTPDEVETFTEQLNSILTHVEELRAVGAEGDDDGARDNSWLVDAMGVGDAGNATDSALLARLDVPGPDPLLRSPADIAPAWQAGFFTVPRLAAMEERDSDDRRQDDS